MIVSKARGVPAVGDRAAFTDEKVRLDVGGADAQPGGSKEAPAGEATPALGDNGTARDMPLISILMAVYEPRMDWLEQQLDSLNAQTYPNLRLYVRDDSSPTVPFEAIQALVRQRITAFPFTIDRNEQNLGSTKTFERLTAEGEGDYFAYCDQDDVWLPEKLSVSIKQIGSAGLLCGDMLLIDAAGKTIGRSITELYPRLKFLAGAGLSDCLVYRNFVIGCTMLMRSDIAKAAIPFAHSMVHDHYLAWYCALEHDIAVADRPLLLYRRHGACQTGILTGIVTKQDYLDRHLGGFLTRVSELSERAGGEALKQAAQWAQARCDNALRKKGAVKRLWSLRRVNRATTMFEIIGLRLPEGLFRLAIKMIRSGRI